MCTSFVLHFENKQKLNNKQDVSSINVCFKNVLLLFHFYIEIKQI